MELVLVVAIWSVIVKKAVVDGAVDFAYAVRGKPSPRWGAKSRWRPDGAASRYFSQLWSDSWDDALKKHSERRERRQSPTTPGVEKPRGAATQFFAGWWQDRARSVRRRWEQGWTAADEKRRARTTRPRPGQQTVQGKVVPNAPQRPPRLFGPWLFAPRGVVCSNCGTSEGVKWVGLVRPVEVGEYLCVPCHEARDCKYCADRGLRPSCPACGRSADPGPSRPRPDQDGPQDETQDRPQDEDGPVDQDEDDSPAPDLQDEPTNPTDPGQDGDPSVPDPAPDFDPDQTQSPLASTTTQEGTTAMTATATEVVGLDSAIRFCEDSARAYRAQVQAIEHTQAAIAAGGVSGPAAAAFAAAMEQSNSAAQSMETAAAEFKAHKAVQEAYNANTGAGTREFVLNGQ